MESDSASIVSSAWQQVVLPSPSQTAQADPLDHVPASQMGQNPRPTELTPGAAFLEGGCQTTPAAAPDGSQTTPVIPPADDGEQTTATPAPDGGSQTTPAGPVSYGPSPTPSPGSRQTTPMPAPGCWAKEIKGVTRTILPDGRVDPSFIEGPIYTLGWM